MHAPIHHQQSRNQGDFEDYKKSVIQQLQSKLKRH